LKNKIISAAVETEVFITGSLWLLKSVQVVYFTVWVNSWWSASRTSMFNLLCALLLFLHTLC